MLLFWSTLFSSIECVNLMLSVCVSSIIYVSYDDKWTNYACIIQTFNESRYLSLERLATRLRLIDMTLLALLCIVIIFLVYCRRCIRCMLVCIGVLWSVSQCWRLWRLKHSMQLLQWTKCLFVCDWTTDHQLWAVQLPGLLCAPVWCTRLC